MARGLWRELWILLGIVVTGLILGLIVGRPFFVIALGLSLYLVNSLRRLHALHVWLAQRQGTAEIPDAPGLWGDVYTRIYKFVKEAGNREDRLTGVIDRFQRAAAVMPDGIVILSPQDEIEWANRASQQLVGVSFPRDVGMRLSNLLRDPEFAAYLASGNYAEPIELPSPMYPDVTLAIQIVPYGANQKMLVFRDVTRMVRLEQTRRHFVANASHELRTPLTVLTGYLETLREMKPVAATELKEHLNVMYEQATRMRRLVDDLLTLSRLETAPRAREETVDVPQLLAELKRQAELLSGEARHVVTLTAEPGVGLRGAREELLSAFSNLANNAVRYTPKDGTILMTWRVTKDGSARFTVKDSGEGIAPEHIPHLTDRFYRVDTARSRASGGTGLGLSIVKHVLLRHDAELRIDSELGRGSAFTCVFPPARVVRASTGDPANAQAS